MFSDLPRITQLVSDGQSQNSNTGLSDLQISVPFTYLCLSSSILHQRACPSAQEERGRNRGAKQHLQNLSGLGFHLSEWVWVGERFYLVMMMKVIFSSNVNPTN